MQDDFIFFRSFRNSINQLPKNKRAEMVLAIIDYMLDDAEPDFADKTLRAVFEVLRYFLDRSKDERKKRSDAGKKGGAPKGNKNASKKQPKTSNEQVETSKKQPKTNKTSVREREIVKEKEIVEDIERNKKEKNSLSQKFLEKFPDKDASLTESTTLPEGFNLDAMLVKIGESDFLSNCNNLGFAWCLQNYPEIMADKYKNFEPAQQQNFDALQHREYSQEEIESVFDNFNEIDL